MPYHKPASFKSAQAFQDYLQASGIHLPFETEIEPAPLSPLAQPFSLYSRSIGNRSDKLRCPDCNSPRSAQK